MAMKCISNRSPKKRMTVGHSFTRIEIKGLIQCHSMWRLILENHMLLSHLFRLITLHAYLIFFFFCLSSFLRCLAKQLSNIMSRA